MLVALAQRIRRLKGGCPVDVPNKTRPTCDRHHLNHDKVVGNHDCTRTMPQPRIVRCQGCGAVRAAYPNRLCWWCQEADRESR
jgi:hypothetical protein